MRGSLATPRLVSSVHVSFPTSCPPVPCSTTLRGPQRRRRQVRDGPGRGSLWAEVRGGPGRASHSVPFDVSPRVSGRSSLCSAATLVMPSGWESASAWLVLRRCWAAEQSGQPPSSGAGGFHERGSCVLVEEENCRCCVNFVPLGVTPRPGNYCFKFTS